MKNILLLLVFVSSMAFAQPTITSFAPTSGPVGTLITINGTNLQNTTAVTIGLASTIIVSKTSTRINVLLMPGAASGLLNVFSPGPGGNVSSTTFTVTATPFPSAQQGSKLVGGSSIGSTVYQGISVAVSADGNTALIGGNADNYNKGAAWVFIRSSTGVWTQQGSKLVGAGAIGNARQGTSVALSADGNTALIGGYADNSTLGATWVFTRSGSTWTQQAKLVGTGAVGAARQGWSVALSANGNTAIIGGNADNSNKGAAWVFIRSSTGVWTQQGSKLVGAGAVGNAQQGWSVALSADGNTALIGGSFDNGGSGATWVFTRSGSTWTQQGSKLVGTGAVGNFVYQGTSVALSANGNTALIGGPGDGVCWVFIRNSSGTWSQQGDKLIGSGGIGSTGQGVSVALSADGNTALIGGYGDNGYNGAAWVFTRSGSTWTQQGCKLVGTGASGSANQGRSVALSANGNTALIGGSGDLSNKGATWVFVRCPSTASLTTSITGPSVLCSGSGPSVLTVNDGCPGSIYNWSNGATTQSISVTTSGNYSVTVYGICYQATASKSVTINPCRTAESTIAEAVVLYPNPTNNNINVVINAVSETQTTIGITDLLGRVLLNETKELISGNNIITYNISDYASGVYLVHVGNGNTQQVFKVIKN